MDEMLKFAWKQYRGWAGAARALKTIADRNSALAFTLVCLTAVLGAAAATKFFPDFAQKFFAVGTLLAGAGTAWFGRYVLDPNDGASWITARSVAEALQSECYRFAAGSGDYQSANAVELFAERTADFIKLATDKSILFDTAASELNDKPLPANGMSEAWYREFRMAAQRRFYLSGAKAHARDARVAGQWAAGIALIAGLLGVITTVNPILGVAPFIAACTTMTTSFASYGVVQRHKVLTQQYTAMIGKLDRIEAVMASRPTPLSMLVEICEDAFAAEHSSWICRMTQLAPTPNSLQSKMPSPA